MQQPTPTITDVSQRGPQSFSVTVQNPATILDAALQSTDPILRKHAEWADGALKRLNRAEPGQVLTPDSRQPRDEPPYRFDEAEAIL